MYRDVVCTIVVFLFSAAVSPVCVGDPDNTFRPVHLRCCREVSTADNWKASRATSGAACFCEVRISGGVHQVFVDQVGTCQPAFR